MTSENTNPNALFCSHVPGVFVDALRLPFIEGLPTLQKQKELRQWFDKHKDLYRNESVVMYHATEIWLPITEEGLKPTTAVRRLSYQSQSGFVYLAATPERAKAFGDIGNQGKSRVYAVNVLVRKLRPDRDQLNNARSVGNLVGNSLAESVLWGGGARVKGAIGPWGVCEVHQGPDGRFQAGSNPVHDALMLQKAIGEHGRAMKVIAESDLKRSAAFLGRPR